MTYEHEEAGLRTHAKRLFRNENSWVERHLCIAWDKVVNQNLQNTSSSEINEPNEPLPRMDSYEQPSCLGSTFVEFPKSQPKRIDNEDLKCEIVMVKMPKCMAWLDDEPIEVEETIGISMEVEPLDHMKLEDLSLDTSTHDLFLSSKKSYDDRITEKPPLAFDELMSTPIDFSAFTMNRLKLNKITRADLVGPVFNLLKGTCKSCIELEYNMEECYHDLTDQLDWANPEGHKILVDMSNPLPLQDKEGRLTIPVEFFFDNDLEYLKAGNKERSYSSSITKTPVARYTLEGIEDMIPTLWSPVIIAYDKDAAYKISH
ncbi:hypothetical protein Tco_1066885 [Tanacetum coccineum]|uniref:Uncharacterized protein n=1 Tax=Tanacetum coccineum TaxID=301880 RepID=A0ABQ5HBN8_9ASTR